MYKMFSDWSGTLFFKYEINDAPNNFVYATYFAIISRKWICYVNNKYKYPNESAWFFFYTPIICMFHIYSL